jgi:hypothetical protein
MQIRASNVKLEKKSSDTHVRLPGEKQTHLSLAVFDF